MDIGLLGLRLLTGVLLGGHAAQKLFGWCSGAGPAATGVLFEKWGHRPGKAMAMLAGTCEATGGLLLAAGLFVPLGAAIIAGTMLVAAAALAPQGIWAAKGGSELPVVYGAIALSLAFTGPGRWSLDQALGLELAGAGWGLAALGAAVLAGSGALARRRPTPAVDPATRVAPAVGSEARS
jgi:putative oxidoreductase